MLVWSPGISPAGTLAPLASFTTDPAARLPHAVAGDLDADGLADLAFAERFTLSSPSNSAVRVLPGASTLGLLIDLDAPFAQVAATSAIAIVLGDLTGDHQPDVLVGASSDDVAGQAGADTLRLHELSAGGFVNRSEFTLRRQTPRAGDALGE